MFEKNALESCWKKALPEAEIDGPACSITERRIRARGFRAQDKKPVYLDLLAACHALLQNRNPFENQDEGISE